MTPTEKDAMALAVLDRAAAVAYTRCECPDSIACTECNFAAPYREARAHLAARLAELEAELAAVRELLAKGRRVPLCGDMPEAIVFVDADARAIDAARGGE